METISARLKAPSTRQSGNNSLDDDQSCRAGRSLFGILQARRGNSALNYLNAKEGPDDAGSFSNVGIRRATRIEGWAKALAPCPPQYADAPGGGLAEFITGRAFARPVGLAHPSQRPWDNIEQCRDDFSIQLFKQPDADLHSRGAIAPELCKTMTLDNRGRRECRMRSSHPQPRVQDKKAHERSHHRYTAISRHSLRDGFTAYSALSPVTGLSCHRRPPRDLLP